MTHEKLKDAEALFSLERYAGTVNRTYYVIFNAASAMLSSIGIECDTHCGVKIEFGELFAKAGKFNPSSGVFFRAHTNSGRTLTTPLTPGPRYRGT